MMSVELRGGGGGMVDGGGGGGGGIDPSNLHLKKELTQIRKAAKVLKDPGTSSTWRSPIGSARSTTKHHYVHHYKNSDVNGNAIVSSSGNFSQLPLQVESNGSCSNMNGGNDKGNMNAKKKENRVFLYNWRTQKSESETSRQIDDCDVENGKDEGSSSTLEESLDVDHGGGNDTKSDSYLSDRYSSALSKYKNANFTPSIRRAIKKKSRRSSYSSASSVNHDKKSQMQLLLSKYSKKSSLGRDDSLSLSDETEDYGNTEDLATISPLLAKFKNRGLLRSYPKKDDDSVSYSTPPLSTSSYNRYAMRKIRNPSTVGSWTGSLNDADDEVDDQLDLGCGIPCYWSRRSTPKSRNGSCYSPSISDTLRRKGSSIFCGSQRRYHNKRRLSSKTGVQGLIPLLTNSADVAGSSYMGSDDEVSTNLGELDLEAVSRLDGRRWSSSCRSQEGLEIVEIKDEGSPENIKSLSHKYRPMFFEELIGQSIVVQSLMNAVSKGRISPVYLFQGPRGTGKTSTARIFAAALNCLSTEETNKPCGACMKCADFMNDKNNYLGEVDGSNKKGIEKIKYFLKNISRDHRSDLLQYRVFVIDECHLLPSKTWLAFLRLLEKPLPRVVFILITTDADNVPRAVVSRCQKHIFSKISSGDIVSRLRKISGDEKLDVELNALELIALNADGSLRDAETMLDQLSLFGKKITQSLVNDLIGVVSEEKLLDLLELAMSSNATETVLRAREVLDSGVDPIALMSQLVTLIVDIIAGTCPFVDATNNDSFTGGRSLSERELDKLKHALTLLTEAEKHLRVSNERSTWFTATLLQLGSMPSPNRTHSTCSRRQSSKVATEEDHMSTPKELKRRSDKQSVVEKSCSPTSQNLVGSFSEANQNLLIDAESLNMSCDDSEMLIDIWLQCIEKCHSKTLRQLLVSCGKLVSISEMKDGFVAHVGFADSNVKTRAEGFVSSITNSFEMVLQSKVDVKIILLKDNSCETLIHETSMNQENTSKSFNVSEGHQKTQSLESAVGNDSKSDMPLRRIESIIHEQRLETAWLQAMDKGTPGSVSHFKPERNQVLPQDGVDGPNESEPLNSMEDELNHEIKALKISDDQKDKIVKRMDHCPISPSLLHNSNFSKDNMGYESGSGGGGCSGIFCWKNTRTQRRGKANQGTQTQERRSGGFSWFGECAKSRTENRYNR